MSLPLSQVRNPGWKPLCGQPGPLEPGLYLQGSTYTLAASGDPWGPLRTRWESGSAWLRAEPQCCPASMVPALPPPRRHLRVPVGPPASAAPSPSLLAPAPHLLSPAGWAGWTVPSAGQPGQGGASHLPPSSWLTRLGRGAETRPRTRPRAGASGGTWPHSPVALSTALPQEMSRSRGPSMVRGEERSPQDLALPPW